MREIKFRAWDNGQMYYAGEKHQMISPDADRHFYIYADGWEFASLEGQLLADENGGVLMQCTGLHDKNGVEIYEGDVVEAKRQTTRDGRPNGSYSHRTVVKWVVNLQKCGFNIGASSKYEVIGNIYENPNLLSKETAV